MVTRPPITAAILSRLTFPGTYGLLLYLPARRLLAAGRLKPQGYSRGWYVYVGSARGPGGVAARVAHHLRRQPRPRWHLDYLRPWVRPRQVWAAPCTREHLWAGLLADLPGASLPAVGFGASDCRCSAHLIYWPRRPEWKELKNAIQGAFPHDPPPIMLSV